MMAFMHNFPFFSIILAMFCGIVSSVLSSKKAGYLSVALSVVTTLLSAGTLYYIIQTGSGFTYLMGHFPAPWGNEIRASEIEAMMATFFSLLMLISIIGGWKRIFLDVDRAKINQFFILIDLLLSSLLALIYTNDLFTGYVFVEINTIAACGLILSRQKGHGIVGAIRYMVMSSIGSGLFLISLSFLYGITGHLLMVPAHAQVTALEVSGGYHVPLLVVIALTCVAMGIKSGLYPFHTWIPDTYGYATPAASAILSSLVSKGYIFLLIKCIYRVFGFDYIAKSPVMNVIFLFGVAAMIMGSIDAIQEKDLRRMIAYSSVAQVGYIYMGIGLGTHAGIAAAIFHILSHSSSKSLLFIGAAGLYEVSDNKKDYSSLRGAGYRNPLAGVVFTIAAFSMVGIPMFSGFISKLLFATSAVQADNWKTIVALLALALSTVLNTVYFLRTVVTLYAKEKKQFTIESRNYKNTKGYTIAALTLSLMVIILGVASQPFVYLIQSGLSQLV